MYIYNVWLYFSRRDFTARYHGEREDSVFRGAARLAKSANAQRVGGYIS
jgi:hypothetical protein